MTLVMYGVLKKHTHNNIDKCVTDMEMLKKLVYKRKIKCFTEIATRETIACVLMLFNVPARAVRVAVYKRR